MRLLLTLALFLTAKSSFAQCISIKQMKSFATKSLSDREDFMEARGYTLEDFAGTDKVSQQKWIGKNGDDFFSVTNPKDKNVYEKNNITVYYMLPVSNSCTQSIKAEIAALRLHKDAEFYKKDSEQLNLFISYYSNDNYAIRLKKTMCLKPLTYWYEITFYNFKPLYNLMIKEKY